MASRLFHAVVVAGSALAMTGMVVGTAVSLDACTAMPDAVPDLRGGWVSISPPDAAWWPDIGMPQQPDLAPRDQAWWPDIGVPRDLAPAPKDLP